MVQDIRAAHRKILQFKNYLNADPQKVYYGGASTGAIAVMSAAFASDDLPTYNEYQNNSGRNLSANNSCGAIDKIGVPLANGEIFKVKGITALAVGIRNTEFIEQTDDVDIMTIAHGQVDDVIDKCVRNLMGITYGYRPGSNDETNDIHLRQYGIRNIYATYSSLTNKYGNFNEYQNTGHGFQGDDTQKMKCYTGTPLIMSCSGIFNPTKTQLGKLIVKDLLIPLNSKTNNDYYVQGQTNAKYYRNVSNATSCATCNYTTFSPPVCNPPTSGITQGQDYSSFRFSDDSEISINQNDRLIYPNPANSIVNVLLPIIEDSEINMEFMVNITDYQGKVIKSQNYGTSQNRIIIPIQELSSGMYIVQLYVNNVLISSEKFIKN
jgi:hypothetical protein